jgi:ribosome-associated protein
MRDIEIPDPPIRLGQLLKLSGVAGSGAEAKALLAQGQITVNGEPELRRGRQLRTGDVVGAAGEQVRVVEPPGEGGEQPPGEGGEQPPGEG